VEVPLFLLVSSSHLILLRPFFSSSVVDVSVGDNAQPFGEYEDDDFEPSIARPALSLRTSRKSTGATKKTLKRKSIAPEPEEEPMPSPDGQEDEEGLVYTRYQSSSSSGRMLGDGGDDAGIALEQERWRRHQMEQEQEQEGTSGLGDVRPGRLARFSFTGGRRLANRD